MRNELNWFLADCWYWNVFICPVPSQIYHEQLQGIKHENYNNIFDSSVWLVKNSMAERNIWKLTDKRKVRSVSVCVCVWGIKLGSERLAGYSWKCNIWLPSMATCRAGAGGTLLSLRLLMIYTNTHTWTRTPMYTHTHVHAHKHVYTFAHTHT